MSKAIKIFIVTHNKLRFKVRLLPTVDDVHREFTGGVNVPRRSRGQKSWHSSGRARRSSLRYGEGCNARKGFEMPFQPGLCDQKAASGRQNRRSQILSAGRRAGSHCAWPEQSNQGKTQEVISRQKAGGRKAGGIANRGYVSGKHSVTGGYAYPYSPRQRRHRAGQADAVRLAHFIDRCYPLGAPA